MAAASQQLCRSKKSIFRATAILQKRSMVVISSLTDQTQLKQFLRFIAIQTICDSFPYLIIHKQQNINFVRSNQNMKTQVDQQDKKRIKKFKYRILRHIFTSFMPMFYLYSFYRSDFKLGNQMCIIKAYQNQYMTNIQSSFTGLWDYPHITEAQTNYREHDLATAGLRALNEINSNERVQQSLEEEICRIPEQSGFQYNEHSNHTKFQKQPIFDNEEIEKYINFSNTQYSYISSDESKNYQLRREALFCSERQVTNEQNSNFSQMDEQIRYQSHEIIEQKMERDKEKCQVESPKGKSKRTKLSEEAKREKNYIKNIGCNMAKVVWNIMFIKWHKDIKKHCSEQGCDYLKFKEFCNVSNFTGINRLTMLLKSTPNGENERMRKILVSVFKKILRRGYLTTALKQGKMDRLQAYLQYKNKYLLNIAALFQ